MNRDTFLECLYKGKLFDVLNDSPLVPYKEQYKDDSFFRNISVALFGKDDFRVLIRSACILRFIMLVFNIKECSSVKEFLQNDYSLRKSCYTDESIQIWSRRVAKRDAKTYSQLDPIGMKRNAVDFVNKNNRIGFVSCRFTFAYLLSGLYNTGLHLYDEINGVVHIQPEIYRSPTRKDDPPTEKQFKRTHIYLWWSQNRFTLLVPIVKRKHITRAQYLMQQTAKHAVEKYQLRVSKGQNTNVGVCVLKPFKKSGIHLCTLQEGSIIKDGIYQIYPAPGLHFQLHLEPIEKLFVFVVREAPTDVVPYLECIIVMEHDITYPYFMLKKDVQKVIVFVSKSSKEEAILYVSEKIHVYEK